MARQPTAAGAREVVGVARQGVVGSRCEARLGQAGKAGTGWGEQGRRNAREARRAVGRLRASRDDEDRGGATMHGTQAR